MIFNLQRVIIRWIFVFLFENVYSMKSIKNFTISSIVRKEYTWHYKVFARIVRHLQRLKHRSNVKFLKLCS